MIPHSIFSNNVPFTTSVIVESKKKILRILKIRVKYLNVYVKLRRKYSSTYEENLAVFSLHVKRHKIEPLSAYFGQKQEYFRSYIFYIDRIE